MPVPQSLLRTGLILALLLLAATACATNPGGDTGKTAIGAITAAPSDFKGEPVTIAGEYRGWQAENGYGPPVTRSDWVIRDDTGWIYVTGQNPGLDPTEDIGTPVEVKGTVRVTGEGAAYIRAESVKVKKEG